VAPSATDIWMMEHPVPQLSLVRFVVVDDFM